MLWEEEQVEVSLSLQFPPPRDELSLIVQRIDNAEAGSRLGGRRSAIEGGGGEKGHEAEGGEEGERGGGWRRRGRGIGRKGRREGKVGIEGVLVRQ